MIEDLWYKNAVIYSLDLETFLDGNGDGTGDFEGLIRRLEYLEFLGVDAVWLAPFQPTPNRDNGYDIRDYYGIDPRHGSSGDFVEFMHQAHQRGIRVLMDLVVNHTSDQHPWFQQARRDPDSRYHDWYVWSEERPPDWDKGMVFPGQQDRTWTKDEEAGLYYFHRFYDFQPDLNVQNPAVRQELRRTAAYWLQLGVAGFRIDALPFFLESVEAGEGPGDKRFEYLAELRRFIQWRNGSAVLLGEANVEPGESAMYFGQSGADGRGGDGVHMMFNFWVNQHLFYALAVEDAAPLVEAVRATADIPETAQWAHFLRNHDELDLGRLSDEQRMRVFDRFAPDENMHLFGRGIRRRLAPMLGDRRHEELAYSLMFSLPGTPVIRFGDELRMGDDLELEGREAVRTPMHWADEPNAGFSTADPDDLVHPVIDEGVWSYRHVNVASQRRDPDSFLNWMARMIRLRKECPEIGWGRPSIVDTGTESCLALRYDWRGNGVLILHNLANEAHEVALSIEDDRTSDASRLSNLIHEEELRADEDGMHRIALDALAYRWFRIGGLDYEVKRHRE